MIRPRLRYRPKKKIFKTKMQKLLENALLVYVIICAFVGMIYMGIQLAEVVAKHVFGVNV